MISNVVKCIFGVSSGKFLGFMVNHRGIETNPEKIQALRDVQRPTNLKELQKFTGMVVTLNCFTSKYSNKCLPFFKALKRSTKFVWTDKCDKALIELKEYLSNPHLISIPEPYEQLFVYLAYSDWAVSDALIR